MFTDVKPALVDRGLVTIMRAFFGCVSKAYPGIHECWVQGAELVQSRVTFAIDATPALPGHHSHQ